LPDKTLAVKTNDQKTAGFKKMKDRLTILFCVNKTGEHKIKPLCIGKSKSPRCFHHVNMKSLPFEYANSQNAWMTSTIFENWFHKSFVPSVRRYLRRKKRDEKAILLDNCPAHPPADALRSRDGKITVAYLPKNTTSKIQPLDQGIIQAFKANYRRDLVKNMVASDKNVIDFLKSVTVKEAIYLSGTAWDCVLQTCIERCWMKGLGDAFVTYSGEPDSESDDEDFYGFTEADLLQAEMAMKDYLDKLSSTPDNQIAVRDWLDADNLCPTYDVITDSEIIESVQQQENVTDEIDTDSRDSDSDTDEPGPPSTNEAVKCFESGLCWLETRPDIDPVMVLHLRNILTYTRQTKRDGLSQTTIKSFFKQ